jgi:hypothetical protein
MEMTKGNDDGAVGKEVLETQVLAPKANLDWNLYQKLKYLGIIHNEVDGIDVRSHNVGASNYSKHVIQPWSIWLDYPELTSWDHDIIKRVLRTKKGDARRLDYRKIIHICEERIRQLEFEQETGKNEN